MYTMCACMHVCVCVCARMLTYVLRAKMVFGTLFIILSLMPVTVSDTVLPSIVYQML